MANVKGTNLRSPASGGKQSFLPPKSPFPSMPSTYFDHVPGPCAPAKGTPKPGDGHKHHQRTSSATTFIEEQPSWLDDLLNEPETPVRRGVHRRSSSDSFAYLDMSNVASRIDNLALHEYNRMGMPSWGPEEFNCRKNVPYGPYYMDSSNFSKPRNRGLETNLEAGDHPTNFPSHHGPAAPTSSVHISDLDAVACTGSEAQDQEELPQNVGGSSERREVGQVKHSQSETDQKRVKQQFAQRSRVRKLQYIAELERNVQALQAEGSEASAELQFIDQQNLILSLENKALKQRLDSLAQEQLLKHLQQEMLEREIARLQAVCQQQQQPAPTRSHRRNNSRDLDSRFADLSLNRKDANSGRDTVTGSLRI